MAHFWSLWEGMGALVPIGSAGWRKGREPVGDAWLLDGTMSNSMPTNLK